MRWQWPAAQLYEHDSLLISRPHIILANDNLYAYRQHGGRQPGRLTRVEEKQVQDKIVDDQVSGTNVVLSIGEEENPQNPAKFELRLTGSGAAEMRSVHHLENKITTQWWKLSRTSGGL